MMIAYKLLKFHDQPVWGAQMGKEHVSLWQAETKKLRGVHIAQLNRKYMTDRASPPKWLHVMKVFWKIYYFAVSRDGCCSFFISSTSEDILHLGLQQTQCRPHPGLTLKSTYPSHSWPPQLTFLLALCEWKWKSAIGAKSKLRLGMPAIRKKNHRICYKKLILFGLLLLGSQEYYLWSI